MKTKIFITTIVLGLFTISTMQAQEKKHDDTKHEHKDMAKDKTMYTCSMHPEVKSEKLGECPKCGMKMIEKKMDMKKEDMKKMDMKKMDMKKEVMKNMDMKKADMKKEVIKKKKKTNHNGHKH